MGTNCAPLPAGLFLHSYEADPLQEIFKNKEIKLDQTIDSSFRYIDGVLSLNNSRLGEYLHFINQNEFDVKDTTTGGELMCPRRVSSSCFYKTSDVLLI
jgi:hypothetical protein